MNATDILAGDYTPQSSIDHFFTLSSTAGFHSGPLDLSAPWTGRLVEGLVGPDEEVAEGVWREALGRRKKRVKGWWMRWTEQALET